MSNPWKTLSPFEVMFCDSITITGKRRTLNLSCDCTACVYPPEDVETFSDVDNESKIKRRKILILKSALEIAPQTGDKIKLDDNTTWKVDNVDYIQDWYDLETRN